MSLLELKNELQKLADLEIAKRKATFRNQKIDDLARFFKTGKGEYGEGDMFLGITVPVQRKIAKKYASLSLLDIKSLLQSKIHEHRLTALFILIGQYQKSDKDQKGIVYNFYIENLSGVNNWDLVDSSAYKIMGDYLLDNTEEKEILYKLVKSDNLWERRISIITTLTLIKNRQFEDTLRLAEELLHDKEDLIHKASGWMLREIGKINQEVEEEFLEKHYKTMPRTMLRYAIERFSEEKRSYYMQKA